MKKRWFIVVTTICALTLSGCGESREGKENRKQLQALIDQYSDIVQGEVLKPERQKHPDETHIRLRILPEAPNDDRTNRQLVKLIQELDENRNWVSWSDNMEVITPENALLKLADGVTSKPLPENWQAIRNLATYLPNIQAFVSNVSLGFDTKNILKASQQWLNMLKSDKEVGFPVFEVDSKYFIGRILFEKGSVSPARRKNEIVQLQTWRDVRQKLPRNLLLEYKSDYYQYYDSAQMWTIDSTEEYEKGRPVAPKFDEKGKKLRSDINNNIPPALVAKICQEIAQKISDQNISGDPQMCGSLYREYTDKFENQTRYYWWLKNHNLEFMVAFRDVGETVMPRLPKHNPKFFGDQRVPLDVPGAFTQDLDWAD
ncbi:hypothetical protein BK816_02435 [Boudabousia tangfeifanii]|uniref:Uncharacterized protein n=1 Tax=Boudabousia tangfeifanii TaxID=1912795 RepID=A0A1D9MJE0_9ACTO|nr:hypothetical protein [Boudabousia tangfeifanii]AOZ72299.1 hypothetical protein BK816_02435 [Boudabousia tangfeifanii]